jgi:hypothetical protein
MCSLHWLIFYQPFAHLTCGCQKKYTMLLFLLILSQVTRRHVNIGLFEMTNTSGVIMAPKLQELLDKFSFTKKILLTLRMKGPTCKPMQMPWFILCHVIFLPCWNHLMVHVWGTHFQKYYNMLLHMKKWFLVYLVHL